MTDAPRITPSSARRRVSDRGPGLGAIRFRSTVPAPHPNGRPQGACPRSPLHIFVSNALRRDSRFQRPLHNSSCGTNSGRPDMLSNRESPPRDSRSGAGMTVIQRSLFTGMTRLEYGAISHNSVENRSLNDRDPRGFRILKQAPLACHFTPDPIIPSLACHSASSSRRSSTSTAFSSSHWSAKMPVDRILTIALWKSPGSRHWRGFSSGGPI